VSSPRASTDAPRPRPDGPAGVWLGLPSTARTCPPSGWRSMWTERPTRSVQAAAGGSWPGASSSPGRRRGPLLRHGGGRSSRPGARGRARPHARPRRRGTRVGPGGLLPTRDGTRARLPRPRGLGSGRGPRRPCAGDRPGLAGKGVAVTASKTDRRLVLKRLGQAGAVLGTSGALSALGVFCPAASASVRRRGGSVTCGVADEPGSPRSSWARGRSPALLVRAAVDAVGGMGRFVRPGETVLVSRTWPGTARPSRARTRTRRSCGGGPPVPGGGARAA